MSNNEIDILRRALAREKEARKIAEKILEEKSEELYQSNKKLSEVNAHLEKNIQEKTSQLKGIFNNIVDAYVVMNLTGDVIKMNAAAVSLLGYDYKEEDINLMNLVYPEDYQKVVDGFLELSEKGYLKGFQVRIILKNQDVRVVQINSSIVYDEDNVPIAAQGIVRDITQSKKAEDLLIASENRMSSLIVNLDRGVLLEDENRKIVLTNKKFCEKFSIPLDPKELVGLDCSESAENFKNLFEDAEHFVERIEEVVKARKMVLGDELKMVNGEILKRDFIPIYEDEVYRGHLWTYKDITLEKKYHQSIEAEKLKYSNIVANMNLGLIEVDVDDKILTVNQSFADMSGYTKEELLGSITHKLFANEPSRFRLLKEKVKRIKGESGSYEIKVKNKKGEERFWLISGAPNYNLNGEVVGSIGVHLDITGIKSLELQKENLLKRLKISNRELEEYAHIVSHDLKSPLRSINALVNWLREDNEGKLDEVSLRNFSLIETTLEKMERLISDILEYSSVVSKNTELKSVDLNLVLEELQQILYIPDHISFKVLKKLPIVNGDITRFQQLFQNLISNAIRYIDKEKGLIEVDVIERPSFYQFSIKDNGIGIEKKNHDKIFKIFQSLNTNKESTGVGLSIVKKIIDLYKGEIWLESKVGKGTTFYFTLIK